MTNTNIVDMPYNFETFSFENYIKTLKELVDLWENGTKIPPGGALRIRLGDLVNEDADLPKTKRFISWAESHSDVLAELNQ